MRIVSALIAAVSTLTLLAASAVAQLPTGPRPVKPPLLQPPETVSASTAPALTRDDLQAWLDGFLPYALQHGELAGAMVVVVKDGQVLFQKGYGYSDVEKKTPVDPERTLFRFGSVSKLLTWTAVMQQVEQGKLDLDHDVNDYLDFKIPPAFGKPITMRNLMTHTAGFEERIKGLLLADPNALLPLGSFVKAVKPSRIFPPGEVPAYSNYGAALAGYIVQRVSGEDFADYIDHHIFQPLGMQRSTFRQPLPQRFGADMSKGYKVASEPPIFFEICGPIPAGALSGTGADMARFMIAHLQEGGDGLLRPKTARLMHESISQPIPPLNGASLGFFETSRNGHRIISHGGDTQVFHSDLELFLDDHVGLFMSFNSSGKEDAAFETITALFQQFADRYFPAPVPQESTPASALEHGRFLAHAGRYQNSRRAESSFIMLLSLLEQQQVSVNEDGTIVLPSATGVSGQPKVWHEISPYVWREVGGKERLAARVDDGKVKFLGTDSLASSEVLQPVPAWKSAAWNVPLLIGAASALLLTVIFWPVVALVRRHFGTRLLLAGREMLAYRGARLAAIANLLFLLGWLLMLMAAMSDLSRFNEGMDPWIRLVQLIGLVGIVGAGVAIWNAWLTCRGPRGYWAKTWSVVVAVSCLSVVWFAFAFKLIAASSNY